MANLLVVDDESSICWGIAQWGEQQGHSVLVAASAEAGLQIARDANVDLLLLDVRLPGMDGISAIEHFRRHLDGAPIIVMTAFGDLDTAMKALAKGVHDYVVKPFDLTKIGEAIRGALAFRENSDESPPSKSVAGMVGNSLAMQNVFKRIALAAHSDVDVLITGESGTGKRTTARAIHTHSQRKGQPIVVVESGRMESESAEQELFGVRATEEGEANASIGGLIAEAKAGVLFFEELADLPLGLQSRLLNYCEQNDLASRPRMIAASSLPLSELLASGELKQELLLLFSSFPLHLPPLRQRSEDIVLLAAHFASLAAESHKSLPAETVAALQSRDWPGNLRELRTTIEHAIVVARAGPILPLHIQPPSLLDTQGSRSTTTGSLLPHLQAYVRDLIAQDDGAGLLHERFIEQVEPVLLKAVVEQCGGEVAPAARLLGLHRTTLKRKLDQYDKQ